MGHLIEKVPSEWSLFRGVQNCTSVSLQLWNKKLRPIIERHLDSTAIILFGVWGHICYNNFVLCGSIFFIHVSNELYLHWISADIKYIDLCSTL